MYFLEQTYEVETAHRLQNHQGLCRNIHGHSYKITVCVRSEVTNDDGMVMDFKDLKHFAYTRVIGLYDHCLLLQVNDPLFKILDEQSIRVMPYNHEPTAEAMAYHIYHGIEQELEHTVASVNFVKVQETTGNSAVYNP